MQMANLFQMFIVLNLKFSAGYFRSQISKAKCQGIDCDEFQARHGTDNTFKDTCIIYMSVVLFEDVCSLSIVSDIKYIRAYQKQLKKDNALVMKMHTI